MFASPFSPTAEAAPFFWSPVFVFGCWGVMLGIFPLIELLTRDLRAKVTKHPQGYFLINGKQVSPETLETFLHRAARLGTASMKVGFVLVASAFAVSLWRS
jgi:hypothetical protein